MLRILAFCAALLALTACGQGPDKAPEGRRVRAATLALEPREAVECRSLPGQVEAKNSAVLSSKISGTVTAVFVEEGAFVQKGQPILQIDDAELRQRRQGAQAGAGQAVLERKAVAAQAALARTNLERMRKLLDQQAVSRDDFDRAQAEFLTLQSKEQALAAQAAQAGHQSEEVASLLSYSTVTAPISGILTRRQADLGAFVNAGAPLAAIDDAQGGFEIAAQADENLLARLGPGMRVLGFVPALSARPFATQLTAVIGHVDPATRTFRVKAALPDTVEGGEPGAQARAGLFGKVCVPLTPARKLLVPEEAVRLRGELPTVLTVDQDQVLRLRIVKTGGRYLEAQVEGRAYILQAQAGERIPGLLAEVLSGLNPGETVVVSPDQTLREGDRLAP